MKLLTTGLSAVALATAGLTIGPAGGTAMASVQPGATRAAVCKSEPLDLPAGAWPTASSTVLTSDKTGKHLLGEAERSGDGWKRPVLWTDGVPQWVDPEPSGTNTAVAVTDDGRVLGNATTKEYEDYSYIYQNGSYQRVDGPAGVKWFSVSSMNNRGDIVGSAWDPKAEMSVPLVRPAGGQWQRLPATTSGDTADISDSGVVIGRVDNHPPTAGVVWPTFTSAPKKLPAKSQPSADPKEIRGDFIGGREVTGMFYDFTGLTWTTNGELTRSTYDREVSSVNSTGDVALAPDFKNSEESSVILRADSSRIEFPSQTEVRYLFDRGERITAAGFLGREGDHTTAVRWTGCVL